MRLFVNSLFLMIIVGCTAHLSFGQKVVANCSKPPGGTVTCESNQAAYCIVKSDGSVRGRCSTPKSNANTEMLVMELYQLAMGDSIRLTNSQLDFARSNILKGEWVGLDKERISIGLPTEIRKVIATFKP